MNKKISIRNNFLLFLLTVLIGIFFSGQVARAAVPVVTAGNMLMSGANGNGGEYIIDDQVIFGWDNSASGDNNPGITGVTVDFSQFGGGIVIAFDDAGADINSCDGTVDGIWTACYSISPGSIDGVANRNVSVTASNVDGPTTVSSTVNATVDNVVPANPTILVYTDPITSGNVTNFSFNGTTPPPGDQIIYWDAYDQFGGVIGNYVGQAADGSGHFAFSSIDASSLADGPVSLYVWMKDAAGNVSTSFASEISITKSSGGDVTPPVVNITAPLAGAVSNATKIITFTDGETTNPQCSINNTNWVACTSGVTTLNDVTGFNALPAGNFTLYLRDIDGAGNPGTDSEVNVIKDIIAPVVNAGTDNSTDTQFAQNATVFDVNGVATYAWTNQTPGVGTITFGSATAEDTTISADTPGTYTIRLTATDNAGNSSFDEMQLILTAPVVDVTAPTITSVSSSLANGAYNLGDVVDIDVNFSEAVTSTGDVTVTLETGATDQTCTFQVTNASSGTCNYTVQASDVSADLQVTSIVGTIADQAANPMVNFVPTTNLAASKALVIDTTAPAVNAGADNSIGAQFTQDATVSDVNGIATYTWTNQTPGVGIITFGSTNAEDTTIAASANGTYTLRLTAVDNAGNSSFDEMQLIWNDVSIPTISNVSSNVINDTYEIGDVIDINVEFSENVTSTGDVVVTLETGDIDSVCTFQITNAGNGTCDYVIQAGDATNDLNVSSIVGVFTDSGGNVMADTTIPTGFNLADSKDIVINTSGATLEELEAIADSIPRPALGSGDDDEKSFLSYFSSEASVKFSSKIPELAGGKVKIKSDGDTIEEAGIDTDGEWSMGIKFKKTTEIKIVYYNEAGDEVSDKKYKINIDSEDPEFTDLPELLSHKHAGEKLWWKAKDNRAVDHYKYTINGKFKTTKNDFFLIPDEIGLGFYRVKISAYDRAGNRATRNVGVWIRR